jgi:hypothetical protein
MSKFLLNEEEIDNIRMMYESYGIILNEESIFGTIARKAVAWAGKNEDDIIKLFQTTEAALAKSIDDIVSASIKTRNLAQLDDLQAKLMHFYNPSGQEAGIQLAKQNTVKFLNAYSKSKGKTSWREIRDEVSGVSKPQGAAASGSAGSTTPNMFSKERISNRWYGFTNPEYLEKIDWSKVSNAKNMDDYNKVIAKAIKTGDYSYVSRGGFEKFGISDFRDYLKNNISKVNEVIPEIGRWSVVFK